MNKVILIGNLVRDPELSQTTGGTSVCRFSIAVQRNFENQAGEREADFFNITVWRGLGDNCHKYLSKGKKVAVVGRLQTRTYEQDGVKRYVTDIIADDVEFLTPKGASEDYAYSGGSTKAKSISDLESIEDDGKLPF